MLDEDQSVIAESSSMNYMQEGIIFDAHLGDGANPDQGFSRLALFW